MGAVAKEELTEFVQTFIGPLFHDKRLESLRRLKLSQIIKRKNPYLFKAKNLISGPDLIKAFLDAHLSSQEEAIFGTFLEGLARFVCSKVHGGRKSSAEGVDLEYDCDGITYIVAIKSGPNWGNSSQIRRMVDNFKKAKRILGTNVSERNVVAINGCCYGSGRTDYGDYIKCCGKEFWELISGDSQLYIDIIEPIGHQARERNEDFATEYAKVITQFTEQFIKEFCENGEIVWERIIRFNSESKKKIGK